MPQAFLLALGEFGRRKGMRGGRARPLSASRRTANYGYPIRVFFAGLTSALARDRVGLTAIVASNVAKYEAAASKIIVAAQRPPYARTFRDRLCRRMLGDPVG